MGVAPPYRVASEGVSAGAWTMREGETQVAIGEWLPVWDVSQVFAAQRHVELDLDAVYTATGLATRTALSLAVSYVSDFEGDAARVELKGQTGLVPVNIDIELAGAMLGASVALHSRLSLDVDLEPDGSPRAWRRGSVLWEDTKRIRLYGESSQLPIMEVDFRIAGLNPAAPWYLDLGADLELPTMGAILLLLNDRFPLVGLAARDFDPERRDLAVVRTAIRADVARTLVEFALAQDDLERDWPDESLGAVLAALVRRMGRPGELRVVRDRDPHKWAAECAATFGLLREPLQ
jgi:hypothetical protein